MRAQSHFFVNSIKNSTGIKDYNFICQFMLLVLYLKMIQCLSLEILHYYLLCGCLSQSKTETKELNKNECAPQFVNSWTTFVHFYLLKLGPVLKQVQLFVLQRTDNKSNRKELVCCWGRYQICISSLLKMFMAYSFIHLDACLPG